VNPGFIMSDFGQPFSSALPFRGQSVVPRQFPRKSQLPGAESGQTNVISGLDNECVHELVPGLYPYPVRPQKRPAFSS
jgi:hypothetical protein